MLTGERMKGSSWVEQMSSFWQVMSQWTTPYPQLKLQPVIYSTHEDFELF